MKSGAATADLTRCPQQSCCSFSLVVNTLTRLSMTWPCLQVVLCTQSLHKKSPVSFHPCMVLPPANHILHLHITSFPHGLSTSHDSFLSSSIPILVTLLNIPECSTYGPSQHTAPPNITTFLWNSLLLNPENGDSKLLQNVGNYPLNWLGSHPKSWNFL
jgi:hypothetical protein